MQLDRAKIKFLGLLLTLLPVLALAQAPPQPTQQCVTSAQAGGTANALTVPLLPCTPTTTLLVLKTTLANTVAGPTLQAVGQSAQTIVQAGGGSVGVGELQPGQWNVLANNGVNWIKLSPSFPFTLGAQTVATDAILAATPIASYPTGVWRLHFLSNDAVEPQFFLPQTGTCTAQIPAQVNDGGSCRNSNDGNSWGTSYTSDGIDAGQFGVSALQADNSTNWNAAVTYACASGKTLRVKDGDYVFTNLPMEQHCAPKISMDQDAILDFSNFGQIAQAHSALLFVGSEGNTTVLTADALIGASAIHVTSATGFCASTTGTDNPACAIRLGSTVAWDPTVLNHKQGEIKFICNINGLILTLCEPLEDSYTTATSAVASPIVMLNKPTITGGKIVAPLGNNDWYGLYFQFDYKARVTNTEFDGFSGEGTLVHQDSWNPVDSYIKCFGIGTAAAAYDSYCEIDDDATEWAYHDHMSCYWTGPCYTAGFTSEMSSTRHVWVTDSQSYSLIGLSGYAFQTHSAGDDFNFFRNHVWRDSATVSGECFGIGVPGVQIVDNICDTGSNNQGILVENETNRGGIAVIKGNKITNVSEYCLLVTQGDFSATGVYARVSVLDNNVVDCGFHGIFVENLLATPIPNLTVRGNYIASVAQVTNTYFGMNIGAASNFDISHNIFGVGSIGSGANQVMLVTDPKIGVINSNVVSLANGTAKIGISVNCTGLGTGNNVVLEGNVVSADTSVASTGLNVSNNCTAMTVGLGNNFVAKTPIVMSTAQGSKGGFLYNTASWNPGLIANNSSTSTTIAVTGAVVGDDCKASLTTSLLGTQLSCYVNSSNSISAIISNNTGAGQTIANSTLTVRVGRLVF